MPESDLHISERLRALLPPLTAEERKQLKENIESDGKVREAILYWHDGKKNVVADGMHRWDIVRGTEIPYKTEELHFANYEEVETWIWNHQAGRRNLTREAIGQWYNKIKSSRGGDHKTKVSNDTLMNVAEKIAEKTDLSPSTVKRAGAREEAKSKLTKAAKAISDDATDAEVKALAKLLAGDQDQVARSVRTGQAKTVKEALKGFSPPKPDKPPKKAKKNSRADWYKQWNTSIGPLVRLVNKIANEFGEKHSPKHQLVKENLESATQNMMDWMGVKK